MTLRRPFPSHPWPGRSKGNRVPAQRDPDPVHAEQGWQNLFERHVQGLGQRPRQGRDFSDVLTFTITTQSQARPEGAGSAARDAGRIAVLRAAPAAGMAAGVLKLSHAEIWLRGDGRTSRLYAENAGDTTLYLDVEQRLLRNPGEQPEELTPIGEVRNPTLLVAPVRAGAGAGQRAPITLKELARRTVRRSGG